jgi:glutathione-regulated potassium-efflux system protein KefB
MVMTPIFVILHDRLMPKAQVSTDGLPAPEDDGDAVVLIGFGRFGQVMTQPLLRMGMRLTIIDTDPEQITTAREFGFKVYFGDGTRLDILRAAGVSHARAVVIAVDNQGAAVRIAEMLRHECPLIPVFRPQLRPPPLDQADQGRGREPGARDLRIGPDHGGHAAAPFRQG